MHNFLKQPFLNYSILYRALHHGDADTLVVIIENKKAIKTHSISQWWIDKAIKVLPECREERRRGGVRGVYRSQRAPPMSPTQRYRPMETRDLSLSLGLWTISLFNLFLSLAPFSSSCQSAWIVFTEINDFSLSKPKQIKLKKSCNHLMILIAMEAYSTDSQSMPDLYPDSYL